ncbi:MAG: MBL fold metallo-hydrolase, partial [Faecalibacterium sp.]
GISLFKIDLICLTHYHGDHIFGLPGLLQTMGSLGRLEPVHITGPVGLYDIMKPLLYLCQGLPFAVTLQEFCAESPAPQAVEQAPTVDMQPLLEALRAPLGNSETSAPQVPEQVPAMDMQPLLQALKEPLEKDTTPAKPLTKKQAAVAARQAEEATVKAKSAGETVPNIVGLPVILTAFPLSHRLPTVGYKITLPRVGKFQPEKALALGVPQRGWGKLQKGESVLLEDGKTLIEPAQVLGEARSGLSVVYATDTRICKGLHLAAKGADLLICDSTYPSDDYKDKAKEFGHSTFPQVAKLAAAQGAKRLWLTHFSAAIPEPAEHLEQATAHFAAAEIGFDGESIDLVFEE